MLSRKDELLEVEPDEPEMLHAILTKLPNPLDLEGLIHRAQELHTSYPPERLPRRDWARIPSSSVLKTTRDHVAVSEQTLQDGERFFEKEATQIRRAEALEALQRQSVVLAGRYRKPLLLTSTAILVAVFSVLMRRLNVPSPHWGVILGLRQYALESWQRYAV